VPSAAKKHRAAKNLCLRGTVWRAADTECPCQRVVALMLMGAGARLFMGCSLSQPREKQQNSDLNLRKIMKKTCWLFIQR